MCNEPIAKPRHTQVPPVRPLAAAINSFTFASSCKRAHSLMVAWWNILTECVNANG